MELRRLRYFLRVAADGSLGKASRALGVAQPALGRQIQLLEAELGVRLFDRVPKGMRLTGEGEYLKEALGHPLEMMDNALRNVRSYTRAEASLVLGLPPIIAEAFGPRVLLRLQRDLPRLRLKIVEDDSAVLAADLARGVVDIALLIGVSSAEQVFHVDVLREQLMLVAPPGSAVAARDSITFDELEEFPLILPGTRASLRTKLAKAELAADMNLNIVLEIDSTELAKRAVRSGSGYAILSLLAFKTEAERGELIGIPITGPEIDQTIRWAVRPLWRVPRRTFDDVELAIFDEWFNAVSSGEWPAEWLLDLDHARRATSSDADDPGQPNRPMLNWHRF